MADIVANKRIGRPRAALAGCGNIAEFHVPALREAGFDVVTVGSRPGSARAREFAARHQIPRVFGHVDDLFRARGEWDALVIAVSAEPTRDLLARAIEAGAPTLVEKPVALRAAELEPLTRKPHPVIVGYNRRFYAPVAAARKEVADGPPLVAGLFLPESVTFPERAADVQGYLQPYFENSVHYLDLARFLFGPLRLAHVERLTGPVGLKRGFGAILVSQRGDVLQVTANFRTPANFTLTLDRPGRRLEVRPFERATVFEGMQVVEPTPETPIRIYRPQEVAVIGLDVIDHRFKPGFVAQARALAALLKGEDPAPAATLRDAHAVLALAEQLIGETLPRS